ncbi:hypothetical protein GOV13_04780 [Candidatus Pacearchaeota archaeon]|nr:hypothetical protein [Candidatus Pacearchaeota archaeon]
MAEAQRRYGILECIDYLYKLQSLKGIEQIKEGQELLQYCSIEPGCRRSGMPTGIGFFHSQMEIFEKRFGTLNDDKGFINYANTLKKFYEKVVWLSSETKARIGGTPHGLAPWENP